MHVAIICKCCEDIVCMFMKLSGYVSMLRMYACIALFRLVMSCKLVENSASQDPSITFEIIFPGMHVSRPSD